MKDYESEVGKLWLKKFKGSKPKEQYKLINIMKEAYPTKPAREMDKELPLEPMQREKEIEYRELLKELAKRKKEKTA